MYPSCLLSPADDYYATVTWWSGVIGQCLEYFYQLFYYNCIAREFNHSSSTVKQGSQFEVS